MSENKLQHGDAFPFHKNSNGDEFRCAVCDRKLGKNAYCVEVTNGGFIHDQANGAADLNDGGYMGAWFVGSECAKQFVETALVKREKGE